MDKQFKPNCKSLISKLTVLATRDELTEQLKEQEYEVFSLPAVTQHYGRKIVFHLKNLPQCIYYEKWFLEDSYDEVLAYIAELEKNRAFDFNTVIALYSPSMRWMQYGFSPMHDAPGIDIKGKLKISPYLPYKQ